MSNNGSLLTVREASQKTGKSEGLIYRYIRQGRINIHECSDYSSGRVRTVKKLKERDLLRVFDLDIEQQAEPGRTVIEQRLNQAEQGDSLTKDSIKEVIEEYFQDRETQLMKPMEEMALYRVGRLEERIDNLEKEKEVILQENEALRKTIKCLPGPAEQIAEKLQALEIEKQEKEELLLRKETAMQQMTEALQTVKIEKETVLKEKEETTEALYIAQTEKEEIVREKKKVIQEKEQILQQIQKEKTELEKAKERAVSELKEKEAEKEKQIQKLQDMKEKAKKEEQDYLATIEEMKKRLEEEQSKPWWKKIFR